jgi:hypothetical protein
MVAIALLPLILLSRQIARSSLIRREEAGGFGASPGRTVS